MRLLSRLAFLLPLVACELRQDSPTEPSSQEEVAIGARLLATGPLPVASHVRLRLLTTESPTSPWTDVDHQPGRKVQMGRIRKGTSFTLDVRAYSLSGDTTVWKWFARSQGRADSNVSFQLVDALITVVPRATSLLTTDPSGKGVVLPSGSRYSLDGKDPSTSGKISVGAAVVVPLGGVLKVLIRTVVPQTQDTLDGDIVSILGAPDTIPHVPGDQGPTDLEGWTSRTKGTTLSIQGAPSSAYASTPPDSATVELLTGSGVVSRWNVGFAALETFSKSDTLDSAALNAGAYRVEVHFRWTKGIRRGDFTRRGSLVVNGFAGSVPRASFGVDKGRTVVTVANFQELLQVPPGWSTAMQVQLDTVWHSVLENSAGDPFPGLLVGSGTASYPLGTGRLRVLHYAGSDTSVVRTIDIGATDSVAHLDTNYPVIRYGARKWISRPMSGTPAKGKFCSDETIRDNCGTAGRLYSWLEVTGRSEVPNSGNNPSQGVCPAGWRIPYSSEVFTLMGELDPTWSWNSRLSQNMAPIMGKARFELKGSAREFVTGPNWDNPAMWTSTTGTSLPGHQDLWYLQAGSATAVSRPPTSEQVAMGFCIEAD
jgi:hypothetical protein